MDIPKNIVVRNYQNEAIQNWRNNGYRGIYDMATGTGKTITAILSIQNLVIHCNGRLGVVILCPYKHLVDQWIEALSVFGIDPVIGYSGSKYGDFSRLLEIKVKFYNKGKEDFFVLLTTNESFKRYDIQYILGMVKGKLLLVSDEAHTMGTEGRLNYLADYYDYRLALSATFERKWDDKGTDELYKFFGKIVFKYTLEMAIEMGVLTPYEYHPIICNLDEDEYREYIRLSRELQQSILFDGDIIDLSNRSKMLLIQRARVVAGSRDKIRKLKKILPEYKKESGMLVYCGATNVFGTEERQLDVVTHLLINQIGILANKFTCEESMDERKTLLEKLSSGKIQALTAIKCLDEGVNVPSIKTAFILASANNSREYIQRRGRVLRKAPGKDKAVIYDFIALPYTNKSKVNEILISGTKYDLSLVKREMTRIEEFDRLAVNRDSTCSIKNEIYERFGIDSLVKEEMNNESGYYLDTREMDSD